MLLLAMPFGLPGQAQLQPAAALACVFFWSVFRPASMPPPVVFVLGLLVDLLGLAPLGSNVLAMLVAHGLAVQWRRMLAQQGFLVVWLAFVGVAAGAGVLSWALGSLLTLRLLPVAPTVFQFGLAAGLYPLLATVFTRAHRSLANPDNA